MLTATPVPFLHLLDRPKALRGEPVCPPSYDLGVTHRPIGLISAPCAWCRPHGAPFAARADFIVEERFCEDVHVCGECLGRGAP